MYAPFVETKIGNIETRLFVKKVIDTSKIINTTWSRGSTLDKDKGNSFNNNCRVIIIIDRNNRKKIKISCDNEVIYNCTSSR